MRKQKGKYSPTEANHIGIEYPPTYTQYRFIRTTVFFLILVMVLRFWKVLALGPYKGGFYKIILRVS